ncbi:Pvc16 family protein [Elioraea sp.]|uniref:Pvc16 family protein n=1 Tax=Elioraea sp. TaxID=2185103 RepID=UPI003F716778
MPGLLPIAGASRTLRTLLRDRMQQDSVAVTLAPPDITPDGASGLRVNLYLLHLIPNPHLANLPPRPDAAGRVPVRPPLGIDLTYLLTSHATDETDAAADLGAQAALADALAVLHEHAVLTPALRVLRSTIPDAPQGAPVMDLELLGQTERLTITLRRAELAEITQIWSALNTTPLRRAALIGVSVVELLPREHRAAPLPVTERRIYLQPFRPPLILDAYRTPAPLERPGERRVRIGDTVTIEGENLRAPRTLVQFGALAPTEVLPGPTGRIVTAAIPDDAALQPGTLPLRVIAERPPSGVGGGEGPGVPVGELPVPPAPRHLSDTTALQLIPRVTAASLLAAAGPLAARLRVAGQRLFVPDSATLVFVGDRIAAVGDPPAGTEAPGPTAVEVRLADLGASAAELAGLPVRVRVNGAESTDAVAVP